MIKKFIEKELHNKTVFLMNDDNAAHEVTKVMFFF